MTLWEDKVSLLKLAATFGLSVAVWLVATQPALRRKLDAGGTTTFWITVAATRLLPFLLIYILLDFDPRGDVPFFWSKAQSAFQLKVVYRDFLSFHAPLFAYLISLPLYVWYSPKALVLLMVTLEAAVVWVTYRHYVATQPDTLARAVTYFMLPFPLIAVLLGGQEEVAFWGFGVATLALTLRRPDERSGFGIGLIWGAAMLTVKSMLVAFLVPLFFGLRDRWRYVAGLVAVGAPALALLFAVVGWAFLMPVQHTAQHMSPNLISVTRPLLDSLYDAIGLTRLNTLGLLLTMSVASGVAWRFRRLPYAQLLPPLYVFTFALFILFEPSAMIYYLFTVVLVWVYALPALTHRRDVTALLLLNALAIVQPIVHVLYAGQPLYSDVASITATPARVLDYALQLATVAGLIWLCLWSVRRLIATPPIPTQPSGLPS